MRQKGVSQSNFCISCFKDKNTCFPSFPLASHASASRGEGGWEEKE